MEKKHFFIRLILPRTRFALHMSEAEKKIMQAHTAYWQGLLRLDIALIFGPVFDPAGGYGVGILEVADEDSARSIMAKDPTILSVRGFLLRSIPCES